MKKVYKSKTVWAAFVLAIVAMVAPQSAQDWAKDNIQIVMLIVSAIFAGLRAVTKGKIDYGFSDDMLSDLPAGIKAPK